MSRPFDYLALPDGASLLNSSSPQSVPLPSPPEQTIAPPIPSPASPSQKRPPPPANLNFASNVLAQVINLPSPPEGFSSPSSALITLKDPLSLPITTANFRRFVARSGAAFWIIDRAEEILLWRRGWTFTASFLSGYLILCFFPHLIFALPLVILLAIMLSGSPKATAVPSTIPSFPKIAPEASSQWFSHVQAIQNVLGVYSDCYDTTSSMLIYADLTPPSVVILLSLCLAISLTPIFVPPSVLFAAAGILVFTVSHPTIWPLFDPLVRMHSKPVRTKVRQLLADDRLHDEHWLQASKPLREVELFENERWSAVGSIPQWSKANLKEGERLAWTRGSDGWSPVGGRPEEEGGRVSALTFVLEEGWQFVETEDWTEDLLGEWTGHKADEQGWVYTNDAWQDPHERPLEAWFAVGATRRRRWTRRIWYRPPPSSPPAVPKS